MGEPTGGGLLGSAATNTLGIGGWEGVGKGVNVYCKIGPTVTTVSVAGAEVVVSLTVRKVSVSVNEVDVETEACEVAEKLNNKLDELGIEMDELVLESRSVEIMDDEAAHVHNRAMKNERMREDMVAHKKDEACMTS